MFKNAKGCRSVVFWGLFALLGLLSAGSAKAQNQTATIQGTVSDTTGAVIPNATVKVTNVDTGATLNTVTNQQGGYTAATLNIGNYAVTATASGFETSTHNGIVLSVGANTVVDFALPVGQSIQTVTVEGQVSQVETSSTTVSSLVDQNQMRELPLNGRNVEQLILLAPGVQQMTSFGKGAFFGADNEYSFSGQRPSDQALLLDDQDIANYWGHGLGATSIGTSLGIDSIAEFETLTSAYSAQYGGAGAVLNSVTKSGTNSFHGSGYEFLRNSALDASNYFQTTGIPPFRKNQFGADIGGPVKKDKVFFFFNYEGVRQFLSETSVALLPDANAHLGLLPCAAASGFACGSNGLANVGVAANVAPVLNIYPIPTTEVGNGVGKAVLNANQLVSENYYLGRVDFNITSKDSFFVRYLSDAADLTEPFANGVGTLPYWPDHFSTPDKYFTAEERHIFSPNLINSARVSFTRTRNAQTNLNGVTNPGTPALQYYPGQGRPDGSVSVVGITTIGPDTQEDFHDVQNKFEEGDDIIWTRGAHTFKFGLDFERIDTNVHDCYIWGDTFAFNNLSLFLQGIPNKVSGLLPGPQSCNRDLRENDISPYFQDGWKVNSKLTVNFGIRYEFVTNPSDANDVLNVIVNPPSTPAGCTDAVPVSCFTHVGNLWQAGNPTDWNVDPRIGIAYDPFANHSTSIRAGFGLYHDVIEPHVEQTGIDGAPPENTGQLGPIPVPVFPKPFSSAAAAVPVNVNPAVDFNTNTTPYTMQWDLSVQRQLPSSWLLSLTYVGSRGNHLLAPVDINPVTFATCAGATQPTLGCLVTSSTGAKTLVGNARINPLLGYLPDAQARAWSAYNGLQAGLTHRFADNFTAQISYTYSHCLDDASAYIGTEVSNGGGEQNPYNLLADKGQCGFDIRHALRVNALYTLPFKGNMLVQGWQLSGIVTASSGLPFSIADGFDYVGDTGASRPNRVSCSQLILKTVTQWYNPACFALQAPGTFGNAGRTNLPGPTFNNLDFSIIKDTHITKISEAFDVQFRAEFFNLFNHPDFSLPSATLFSGANYTTNPLGNGSLSGNSLNQITSTASTSRQIQFGLKILF
jgi:hypothetical protein